MVIISVEIHLCLIFIFMPNIHGDEKQTHLNRKLSNCVVVNFWIFDQIYRDWFPWLSSYLMPYFFGLDCYQKLFWPFTVRINCSGTFFLTVGQNNFGNKIPFHRHENQAQMMDCSQLIWLPIFSAIFLAMPVNLQNSLKEYKTDPQCIQLS